MRDAYRSGARRRETAPRLGRLLAAGAAVLALAGCSFAIPSILGGGPEETTGSIPKKIEARLSPDLAHEDWRRAKGALALALDPQGNGRTVKWDNPDSRMKGEITPAGPPFVEDDEICRRFTATIEPPNGNGARLEGRACRLSADEWAIKTVGAAK